MSSLIAFTVAALAASVHANPIPNPQDVSVIGVGTTSGDADARAQLICALSATDSLTWENSGAQFFLNNELEKNGPGN
jgi:hypothetical protein